MKTLIELASSCHVRDLRPVLVLLGSLATTSWRNAQGSRSAHR